MSAECYVLNATCGVVVSSCQDLTGEKSMRPLCVLLLFCGVAAAQSDKPLGNGPWDFGVRAGGGVSVPGGSKDSQAANAGLRVGKGLTDEHLGGRLPGQFECSADLIPVSYVLQPAN